MKRLLFYLSLMIAFVIFPVSAWSYTAYIGSVSWRNQGGNVYDSKGSLWTGDDFIGSYGTQLTTPPYVWLANPSAIFLNGDGRLALEQTDPHSAVGVPNYDHSGNWLSIYDADFVVNLQAGPPDPGYSFSMMVRTSGGDDCADLGVGTLGDGSWTGFAFEDETHQIEDGNFNPLISMSFDGYTSLGLRLHVDGSGNCTPYYWVNPPDGILDPGDPNWNRLGTAMTQIDLTKIHSISFSTGTTTQAVPAPLWPLQVGQWYEYQRSDSAGNVWTVRLDVVEEVTLDSQDYFHIHQIGYGEGRPEDDFYIRSTDDAIYSYWSYTGAGEVLSFITSQPEGYSWTTPGSKPGRQDIRTYVGTEKVEVPYGGPYTAYVYEISWDTNNDGIADSPSWFEYLVPGIGIVKEIDYNTETNPPKVQELVRMGVTHGGVFTDVLPAHWASDYINAIKEAGITTGYGDGTYGPEDPVSRDQMAVFIIRALYGETVTYSPTPYFADVPSSHWAFKYIQKLKELGITTGCGSGQYCPEETVTRDQMAAFLVRARAGEDFSCSSEPYFTDVPSNHWAFDYIQKLKELGITTGYGDGGYGPGDSVTRDQMAAFLWRAFLQ
jgi:hypothetical protein